MPTIPDKRDRVPMECDLIVDINKVILEEYTFAVQKTDQCTQLAEWIAERLKSRRKIATEQRMLKGGESSGKKA